VEFVLAFPIVMTVVLGILELSLLVFSYSTIANAAQEGARYGALQPATVSGACANPGAGIGDAVCRLTAGLRRDQVQYTAVVTDGVLRVTVAYRYQAVSGPIARVIGGDGTLALSAAATAVIE
jgi:Flp pilus assembly protein TadG